MSSLACGASASQENDISHRTTMNLVVLHQDELRLVFQYLTIVDLGQCAAVCRTWHRALIENDGPDPAVSVWRLKYEERWWKRLEMTTTCAATPRDAVRECVRDEHALARQLRRGQFVGSCETRPWLLAGNDSPIVWLASNKSHGATSVVAGQSHHQQQRQLVTVHKSGQVKTWQFPFETHRPVGTEIHAALDKNTKVQSVAEISNTVLVLGATDGRVPLLRLLTSEDGTIIHARIVGELQRQSRCIMSICADSSVIITVSGDLIRIFDVAELYRWEEPTDENNALPILTVTRIIRGHTPGVNINWVQFGSLDGTILSGSADQTVRLWNYETGECLSTWSIAEVGGPTFMGSNRYTFVVRGGTFENSLISLLSFRSGNEIRRIDLHGPGQIQTTALYEELVLLGTKDGRLKEYNLLTGECSCSTQQPMESCPRSLRYLGRNSVYLVDDEHRLVLFERTRNGGGAVYWRLSRVVTLNIWAESIAYDADSRTLLVISSGYTARIFVFQDDDMNRNHCNEEKVLPS